VRVEVINDQVDRVRSWIVKGQFPHPVDLAYDCLHHVGPDRWAIHVPLGKLKTERIIPVDSLVCELVQRLRFFRSFDPLPADGRLLARHKGKQMLIKQLRPYLSDAAAGISTRIVPHQFRHYAASLTMPHRIAEASSDRAECAFREIRCRC
jgi:integrase